MDDAFVVEAITRLGVRSSPQLDAMYLLSPFVWQEGAAYRMLVRVVNRDDDPANKIARIHAGRSADGVTFAVSAQPAIAPGPEPEDRGGCEDPTVAVIDGRWVVYYAGWDPAARRSTLLRATGRDDRTLSKQGVALPSTPRRSNPKEATLARDRDGCVLFFEYAQGDASRIGVARGPSADGPWTVAEDAPFDVRADAFDAWHLSPGPVVDAGRERRLMFYNGADREARWRIGWIAFDAGFTRVVARCAEPLLVPPPPVGDETDIAFAASAVEHGETIDIYYTVADKTMMRARLRAAKGWPR